MEVTMEKTMTRSISLAAGLAGAALLAGGVAAMPAFASEAPAAPQTDADAGAAVVVPGQSGTVRLAAVQGTFAFTQGEVTPLPVIARAMGDAARYLCGAGVAAASEATSEVDAGQWVVTVTGDVENAYSATLDELAEAKAEHSVMGCSCSGNPAGGQASVNADVTGIPVQTILELAAPAEGANTVVFVSSDGYEVALPLFYMKHHYSLLAYAVNGRPLADSMGGTNQLWLGSTSARYYGRDIVEIRVETRDQEPAAPGTPEAGAEENVPNASVTSADAE